MADKSTSKSGGGTKNKKLKTSNKAPADDAFLSDKKPAMVEEKDSLCLGKRVELNNKKPKEIKCPTDILNEMINAMSDDSSTSLKISSLRSNITSTPTRRITVKKEVIKNATVGVKPLSKVSAYKPTPIKPFKPLNVQTDEANCDKKGIQTSAEEMKKEGNVIRLALKDLSDEERKKLRAKRFNIIVADTSESDKASTKTVPNRIYDSTSISANKPTPTFDTLKKRAERFGENVSSVMKSLDLKEKMLKRKLKFLESVTNLKELELRKKRAERFRMA